MVPMYQVRSYPRTLPTWPQWISSTLPTWPQWISPVATTLATPIIYPTINQTTSTIPRLWYGLSNMEEQMMVVPQLVSQFVPYTPAIIRRLSDQHEREEDRIASAARQAEREAARAIEQELLRTANNRAKELLLSHLTAEQRKTFNENGWFIVEGGRTKQKYRINGSSISGNIDVLGKNHRLCAHAPHGMVPHFDHLLTQKVMIELAEDDFLRVANRH